MAVVNKTLDEISELNMHLVVGGGCLWCHRQTFMLPASSEERTSAHIRGRDVRMDLMFRCFLSPLSSLGYEAGGPVWFYGSP